MTKPNKVYIILRGKYFDDMPLVYGTARTKAEAGKLCRAHGHKWNKEQQLFLNDTVEGTRWWFRVVVAKLGETGHADRVSYGRLPGQKARHFCV